MRTLGLCNIICLVCFALVFYLQQPILANSAQLTSSFSANLTQRELTCLYFAILFSPSLFLTFIVYVYAYLEHNPTPRQTLCNFVLCAFVVMAMLYFFVMSTNYAHTNEALVFQNKAWQVCACA